MDPGGLAASRAQSEQRKSTQRMMAVVNFSMPLLKHVTSVFRPTADAAADLVEVSVSPKFRGMKGYYVGQHHGTSSKISQDRAWQARLWKSCWNWTGLDDHETVLKDRA
jgi:WW domain-containing oxidoreductase